MHEMVPTFRRRSTLLRRRISLAHACCQTLDWPSPHTQFMVDIMALPEVAKNLDLMGGILASVPGTDRKNCHLHPWHLDLSESAKQLGSFKSKYFCVSCKANCGQVGHRCFFICRGMASLANTRRVQLSEPILGPCFMVMRPRGKAWRSASRWTPRLAVSWSSFLLATLMATPRAS